MNKNSKLISDIIDAFNRKQSKPCDDGCVNYQKAFNHRDRSCVLSDVYSVKRGCMCKIYREK